MHDENDYHTCHFCGEYVKDGYEYNGARHYLSDCRPDLVKHEIGATCTWAFRRLPEFKRMKNETEDFPENHTCYGYQDGNSQWTNEHIHFYPDGPM
jgi:hypothetical protein